MLLLFALAASTSLASFERELPLDVTPIADLGAVEDMRHAEVLQVQRDFGRPNVNVALDAWMPSGDLARIDAVRVWWSDEVDRYPFSEKMQRHLDIGYRRVAPHAWRVSVAGDGKRFEFDVALHDGRPAAFADVRLAKGRTVRHCRAYEAQLRARRFVGIPVGIHSMVVSCLGPDGRAHRGVVKGTNVRRR